jgi:hypothetical protein
MRCVASLVSGENGKAALTFETAAGILNCACNADGTFTVDMGAPRLAWDEIPLAEPFHDTRRIELQIGPIDAPVLHSPSAVNMGNPHAVFWVDDVNAYDLHRFGPLLENHPIFPERANITLAHIVSRGHIVIRTWERGAGLTQACGSAACAAAVAAARASGQMRPVAAVRTGRARRGAGSQGAPWSAAQVSTAAGHSSSIRHINLTEFRPETEHIDERPRRPRFRENERHRQRNCRCRYARWRQGRDHRRRGARGRAAGRLPV